MRSLILISILLAIFQQFIISQCAKLAGNEVSVINTDENKTKKDEPLMQFVTDCKGQFCQTRQAFIRVSRTLPSKLPENKGIIQRIKDFFIKLKLKPSILITFLSFVFMSMLK